MALSPCGTLRQAASTAAANDPDNKPRLDSCPLATRSSRVWISSLVLRFMTVGLFRTGTRGSNAHAKGASFGEQQSVFVRGDGVVATHPEGAELRPQRRPGDAQQSGGIAVVAAGLVENEREEQPVHLAVRLRVQVARVPRQLAADESLEVEDRRAHRAARWGGEE